MEATREVRHGNWWAKLHDSSEWAQIPDERIVRERNSTPEQAHLCYLFGKVLCFVPPEHRHIVNATLPEDGPRPTAIHVRDYAVAIRRRSSNSYSSLTSWKVVCGESCLSKAYRSCLRR